MRFDLYLQQIGRAKSRTEAKALIEEGKVFLDGKCVQKAAFDVADGLPHRVEITEEPSYVGRGGLKLAGALDAFGIDPSGMTAVDIGASTGGFTDCLLQRGAKLVYAVDAGRGQLADVLLADERVRSFEGLNARTLTLEQLGAKPFDLIVMDVSFISATYIIPQFRGLLRDGGLAVSLIKPQFEVGKSALGKRGIVKDPVAQESAIRSVLDAAARSGLTTLQVTDSPIFGGDGNREFFACFQKREEVRSRVTDADIHRLVFKK